MVWLVLGPAWRTSVYGMLGERLVLLRGRAARLAMGPEIQMKLC